MKNSHQHIILRQTLELEVGKTAITDQHALMERLSALGQNKIPQLLDATLHNWLPAGEYRRIDQLVLTVEVDSLENLESTLQSQLPVALKRVLEEQQRADASAVAVAKTSGPRAWIIHFLRTGTLPWSAPQALMLEDWQDELHSLLANDRGFAQALLPLFLAEPFTLQRMLQQFGALDLWLMLKTLNPQMTRAQLTKLQGKYKSLAKENQAVQVDFWQQLLTSSQEQLPDFTLEQNAKSLDEAIDTGTTTLYLLGAGLVLLHPFLPTLLKELGLADEKQIHHPAQAAALLYALQAGENPVGEWQLVLPKILLGIPLEQPLEIATVTREQMAAGEEMIQAAIQHWQVLGNTSVAGFRESFLQRPGRLQRTDNGWQLTLEQRPYDMLLEQLPWQMSYIRLPWMVLGVWC